MSTIGGWWQAARQYLRSLSFEDDVDLTLSLLLAHHLGKPRAWLYAHPDAPLPEEKTPLLKQDLDRIAAGFPLPYLLGEWEFFGVPLQVTPDVLIPRPETELLVDTAMLWLKKQEWQSPPTILDIGTGSGAIAIAIGRHIEPASLYACDRSLPALRLCKTNLQKNHLANRVHLMVSDGIPPLQTKFDLICANLPYIPSSKLSHLPVAKYEPRLALDGGADGFRIIEQVLVQAKLHLMPSSLLLFEIESSQGALANQVAHALYPYSKINIMKDLAGNDRILSIERQ